MFGSNKCRGKPLALLSQAKCYYETGFAADCLACCSAFLAQRVETNSIDRERRQRLFQLMLAIAPSMESTPGADTDASGASSSGSSVKDHCFEIQCPGLVILADVSVSPVESEAKSNRPDVVGAGEMLRAVVKVRGYFPQVVKLLAADMR